MLPYSQLSREPAGVLLEAACVAEKQALDENLQRIELLTTLTTVLCFPQAATSSRSPTTALWSWHALAVLLDAMLPPWAVALRVTQLAASGA